MEAPDGEPLCTMDKAKATWYQKKGLAIMVSETPLRMRLTFEPSGRAVGNPGKYDLLEKENRCVVCGTSENLSRKFIVPKEYRKFFPTVMKSHSSHDILLLCSSCHRTSSMEDNQLRTKLAIQCDALLVCHLKCDCEMPKNRVPSSNDATSLQATEELRNSLATGQRPVGSARAHGADDQRILPWLGLTD